MQIIEDFIPKGRNNRSGIAMDPTYITIHDTGNASAGADAKSHANYVKTTDLIVSWHYTVDDHIIYQHLPVSEIGWHAGDGNGYGNYKSIGIEICMNSDGNRQKAEENSIELIVYLMKKYNIDIDHVVQHNNWSGKNCPQVIRSRVNGWMDFLADIEKVYEGENPQPEPGDVPEWQVQAFNDFVKRGILDSPEYWEERLGDTITVGEFFAIFEKTLKEYVKTT